MIKIPFMTVKDFLNDYPHLSSIVPECAIAEKEYWVVLINTEKHTFSFRDTRYENIESW